MRWLHQKTEVRWASWAIVIWSCLATLALAQAAVDDLHILGGRIVDGSGAPWYLADVAVHDGRIVAIGPLSSRSCQATIDAQGLVVAPGFVDLMGQSATSLLDKPQTALNLLSQGITTINCGEGVSAAPLATSEDQRAGWTTMREYFAMLDMQGLPLNVVQTVGHTQVRRIVLGDVDRRPSPEELAQMEALVAEAMEAGAIGVSTALIYPPAIYATTEEIAALVRVAGRYGGGYYTHMRNEGDQLLEAIEEALEIGQMGNASVHIFHLKTAGQQNWHKMPLAIARIQAARAAGQQVTADVYPYVNNGLSIAALVHPRHFTKGPAALMIRLDNDPETTRSEIRQEMTTTDGWENWFRHVGHDWSKIIVGQTPHPRYRPHQGQSLAAIAEAVDEDPWDTFFQLLRAGAFVLPESMSEANKILAMQQEFISFSTDVGPAGRESSASHPRAYGSFPRLFSRYVRELGALSLERAVSQASAAAANHVKVHDRGRIAVGLPADLVLFDPQQIADAATFQAPAELSSGVQQVIVGGQVVYRDGQLTRARPGRVLRGPGYRQDARPAERQEAGDYPTLQAFDQMARDFLDQHRGVGLAVAVTRDGQLVHASGYGYADLAQDQPVTPHSLFRIASISKPITAVAILQLVEQQQLNLDDGILDYLDCRDDFEQAGPDCDPRWASITIRHLLEHRGGWDRDRSFDAMFRSVAFAQKLGVPCPAGCQDVIRAMVDQPLDFDPGQRYAYSNFGYNLLGRVIEKITGQTYEAYVQQHVLEPLGIQSMRIGNTRLESRTPGEVRYYHPGPARSVFADDLDQPVPAAYGAWHLEAMDSHGGWIASAVDLVRFAAAFDDPANCPLLSEASVRLMAQRPEGAAGNDGDQPKDVYYSLGWQVRDLGDGRLNHWHTGSLPGTATILIRRHDGLNFVALLNSRVSPTASHLGREIDAALHRAAAQVKIDDVIRSD